MAPMRLALALATLAAMASNASVQVAGRSLPLFAHVGLIEPLRAQTVDHVARLVGNPFLVDVIVGARQDAHHLAAAGVDADGGAERVHHVDRLRSC